MTDHKRSARDAGVHDYSSNSKAARTDASLDPRVADKLEDLFATGLLARSDLDPKVISELASYDCDDGLQILRQFEAAGLENIRNKSGYLHGVMIRYRKEGTPRLARDVYARLDKMYRSSHVKASDLDQRVFDMLSALPPAVAIRTIDRFQARCGDDVRNISAFFNSMLRTEMEKGPQGYGGGYHDGPPPRDRGQYGGPPARGGYDSYEAEPRGGAPPYDGGPGGAYAPPDPYARGGPPPGPVGPPTGGPPFMHEAGPYGGPPPGPYGPPGAPGPAPAPPYPQVPQLNGKSSHAAEQAAMGIRVGEFHGLSVFAEYVHPAPALKLQQLWDGQYGPPNRLVSLLDDRSWEVLSELAAPEGLAVIDQVAEAMGRTELRNPNAFFMSCCKKYVGHGGGGGGHGGGGGGWDGPPARGPPVAYDRDQGRGPPLRGGPAPGGPGGPGGGGGGSGGDSMSILSEVAQQRAQEAITRHYPAVSAATFDRGLCEGLKRLSHEDTMGVFDELMAADMKSVRSVPAYVMGMIRKRQRM